MLSTVVAETRYLRSSGQHARPLPYGGDNILGGLLVFSVFASAAFSASSRSIDPAGESCVRAIIGEGEMSVAKERRNAFAVDC